MSRHETGKTATRKEETMTRAARSFHGTSLGIAAGTALALILAGCGTARV